MLAQGEESVWFEDDRTAAAPSNENAENVGESAHGRNESSWGEKGESGEGMTAWPYWRDLSSS